MKEVLLNARYGDYKVGRILSLDEEEAASVVSASIGAYIEPPVEAVEPASVSEELPSLEAFADLSASEQRILLVALKVEGDSGNEPKRSALYAAFLQSRADGAGGGA